MLQIGRDENSCIVMYKVKKKFVHGQGCKTKMLVIEFFFPWIMQYGVILSYQNYW